MTQTAITREPVAGRRLKAERLNGARALREAQAPALPRIQRRVRRQARRRRRRPRPRRLRPSLRAHRRPRPRQRRPGGHHPAARPSRRRTPRALLQRRGVPPLRPRRPARPGPGDRPHLRRSRIPQRRHHRGTLGRTRRGPQRGRLPLPDGLRQHSHARRRYAGQGGDAAAARTLPVHRLPAGRAEEPAAAAGRPGKPHRRAAAAAQGLHAPGRQDLRRALLGPDFQVADVFILLKRDELARATPATSRQRSDGAAAPPAAAQRPPARAGRARTGPGRLGQPARAAARRRRHAAAPAPDPLVAGAPLRPCPSRSGQRRSAPATHAVGSQPCPGPISRCSAPWRR